MTATLDGPRLVAKNGKACSLVVLVHGYGANGEDLIGLAQAWRDVLPTTAFVAPNAPERLPFEAVGGYQWFDLTFRDPDELWQGCQRAGPLLDQFIDQELSRLSIDGSRLALVGFSQGTMLSLHVGLRRRPTPAAILGYSGIIAGPEHLEADRRGRPNTDQPPILLMHGEADEVIPSDALTFTTNALATAGLAAEWHLSPGLGHGIDMEGVEMGGRFLTRALTP
ncbi:MAG: alpha/beta hydrolase [Hyphomicrobiaceae bacterium]